MNHSIRVEKFGVRLRPVGVEDAGFILGLRNQPHTAGFIGDSARDEAAQRDWIERYLVREKDYYFVAERLSDQAPIGTIGLYDFQETQAEWGRWVMLPRQGAGAASVWLVLHVGFDLLQIETIKSHATTINQRVIEIHERMGFRCLGLDPVPVVIGGRPLQQFHFQAAKKDWPSIATTLQNIALKRE